MEKEKGDCIFCKIASGEVDAEKILENDNFLVIKDIKPRTKGHLLVISKKHYHTLFDMPSSLFGEFLETAKEAAFKILQQEKAKGFNLIMNNFEIAGQLVPHVHLHILPRYEKNGSKPVCDITEGN